MYEVSSMGPEDAFKKNVLGVQAAKSETKEYFRSDEISRFLEKNANCYNFLIYNNKS
jgi:hypothetical protein